MLAARRNADEAARLELQTKAEKTKAIVAAKQGGKGSEGKVGVDDDDDDDEADSEDNTFEQSNRHRGTVAPGGSRHLQSTNKAV
jgi:hypothetical protein